MPEPTPTRRDLRMSGNVRTGRIEVAGVDIGPNVRIVAIKPNGGLIAVHRPGHSFFSGIGNRSYAEARFEVFVVDPFDVDDKGKFETMCSLHGQLEWSPIKPAEKFTGEIKFTGETK